MKSTPDTVTVGGIDYKVLIIDDLKDDDDKEVYGEIEYLTGTIKINAAGNDACRRVTLWHEIIHAILTHAGYDEHNEPMISALSYGIYQVLRDNPKVMEAR